MALRATQKTISLTEQEQRNLVLLHIHTFRSIDDDHPTVFLQWAALLPLRQREFDKAKQEGRDATYLKHLEGVVRLAANKKEKLRLNYEKNRTVYRDNYVNFASTVEPPF